MLREADAAAENGAVVRQRAAGEDDGVDAAAEDAAQRRGPEVEDPASVLGELGGSLGEGLGEGLGGIDALDAMLADRAVAAIADHAEEDAVADAGTDPGAALEHGAWGGLDEPASDDPEPVSPAASDRDVEPIGGATPDRASVEAAPASAAAAAAPEAREAPATEARAPEAAEEERPQSERSGVGAALAGVVGTIAWRMLGGVSSRLERLSPTARQTISWAACLTALNAAAVWTVLVLRWSAPALPPKEASEAPGEAEKALVDRPAPKGGKAAAKREGRN